MIHHKDIVKLHGNALSFTEELKPLLNTKEFNFLIEGINSREIPEPQLLIKDHKKMKNGAYLTRLIIPSSNFAATFSKLGYLGIKHILDTNNVNYTRYTIQQASELKEKLEKMNLKENKITSALLDVVNMYLSTSLLLIKQAMHHYTKNLSVKDKLTFESSLPMISFGMQSMLTRFKDQYFNYKGIKGEDNGEKNADDNGLAIGLFEYVFCADMCATYIFEMREQCFWHAKYKGIYHNDSLVIFSGKLIQNELALWLKSFQKKVDTL
eukprot:13512734-Ditylum_brightwellii.AAC.1